MTVGFQCFNDQGTIQFDSELSNYALVSKGTIQTGDFSDPTYGGSWSLGYRDNLPAFDTVALSCTTSPVIPGVVGFDDKTDLYVNARGGSHLVTYYLFRLFNKLPKVGGAGIEIVDAQGRLTYSTGYRPLCIVAKHPVTNLYEGISEGRGLPGGRTYAFMKYGTLIRAFRPFSNMGGVDIGDVSFNGSSAGCRSVTDGYYIEEIKGNCYADGLQATGGILAVDVTGI